MNGYVVVVDVVTASKFLLANRAFKFQSANWMRLTYCSSSISFDKIRDNEKAFARLLTNLVNVQDVKNRRCMMRLGVVQDKSPRLKFVPVRFDGEN